MIFMAITSEGLVVALESAKIIGGHVWCGSDAVSESDGKKMKISRFNYSLMGGDKGVIDEALETIREHHPGQVIWVEGMISSV